MSTMDLKDKRALITGGTSGGWKQLTYRSLVIGAATPTVGPATRGTQSVS